MRKDRETLFNHTNKWIRNNHYIPTTMIIDIKSQPLYSDYMNERIDEIELERELNDFYDWYCEKNDIGGYGEY